VLSYFVTWFIALQQTVFSVFVLARLLFYFLIWVLVFAVIMAVMERITHRALFGNKILGYYPWKIAATISIILSLLLGVSYAFTGDTTLTSLRIATLLVGFVGCVVVLMWYLHTMVKE
jgi:hypothetical protein